jgi:hypothetical protein
VKPQTDSSSQSKVLKKIKIRFSRFRNAGGGRYPPRLKSMVVSAVSDGLGKRSVARAAGISTSMIYYWMAGAPKAKRLNLVEALPPRRIHPEVIPEGNVVCVRLASGVEIDFPKGELTSELLATLNAIGGRR